MSSLSLRIDPLPGFSPMIGRLVGMLTYVRDKTVVAVSDLTMQQLDALHDTDSNSIGALLSHVATVERIYQIVSFEERHLLPDEEAAFADAHVPEMNAHWAWFHVLEDEISHRGQIRWLRARIPAAHD